MSNVVRLYAPRHRNPDDYDLPRGEWICIACARKKHGLSSTRLCEFIKEYGIEVIKAAPLTSGKGTGRAACRAMFYDKHHLALVVGNVQQRERVGNGAHRGVLELADDLERGGANQRSAYNLQSEIARARAGRGRTE